MNKEIKAALLVIDLQKGFIKNYPCFPNLELTLEYVNGTIDLFRKKDLPVIVVKDLSAEGENFPDAFDLIDGLMIEEGEFEVIEKTLTNSFWKTDLEERLRSKGVEFVVIAGFAAEYCVYGTYQGATERGFHALILKNGITTLNENYALMIEHALNDISYFTLAKLLS